MNNPLMNKLVAFGFTALLGGWAVALPAFLGLSVAQATETASSDAAAGIMVRPFTGTRAETLTQQSIKALQKSGLRVVRAGAEGNIKLAEAPEPYVAVAEQNRLKAYVHANVVMSKTGWILNIMVRNAKDGRIIAEPTLRAPWLPGLLKKIDQQLATTLADSLARAELPGSPSPADEDTDEEPVQTEPADRDDDELDTEARPSPFDGNVAVGLMYREVAYVDPVSDAYSHALQPPSVGPLTLRLGAHWYPLAHFSGGFASHVGLALGYYRSAAGATEITDSMGKVSSFDTTFKELNVGLRVRIPLDAAEVGLQAGWGTAELSIAGDNEVPVALAGINGAETDPGVVPDAAYNYLRFGPDLTFSALGVDWNAGAFYRLVTLGDKPGQWSEPRWFPKATASAIEVRASALIALSESVGLLLGLDARRYALAMNSGTDAVVRNPVTQMPTGFNQAVAGGATDLYLGAFAGLQFTLVGQEAQATGGSDGE